MYDPRLVQPMRDELTTVGVKELKTPSEVEEALGPNSGTVLVVVNSICGCAAGAARPAVGMAMKNSKLPKSVTSVFAGQDKEATDKARSYFHGYPPSSPSFALLKDGKIVQMIPRSSIEGNTAEGIAKLLTEAFDKYC